MNRCRRPVCAEACIQPPLTRAGAARQLLRGLGLAVALGAGVLTICAATSIPGYRRRRRGSWAVRHAARWVLRALGVRTTVQGAPRSGPSLVVGNHVSWLDILVLAGCTPMVMVAKSEVRSWPVIGGAAVRAGTIFLQRNALRALPGTVEEITAALRSGLRVQVFPEGTTRCGGAVGAFHRAAFQAAINAAVVVSPVAVDYVEDGHRGTTGPAFVGEESLLDSLRRVLAAERIDVTVRWLTPIPAIAGTGRHHLDRATVARLAQNAVAKSLAVPIVPIVPIVNGGRVPTQPEQPLVPGQAPVSSRPARPVAPR